MYDSHSSIHIHSCVRQASVAHTCIFSIEFCFVISIHWKQIHVSSEAFSLSRTYKPKCKYPNEYTTQYIYRDLHSIGICVAVRSCLCEHMTVFVCEAAGVSALAKVKFILNIQYVHNMVMEMVVTIQCSSKLAIWNIHRRNSSVETRIKRKKKISTTTWEKNDQHKWISYSRRIKFSSLMVQFTSGQMENWDDISAVNLVTRFIKIVYFRFISIEWKSVNASAKRERRNKEKANEKRIIQIEHK